jgi:putative transposase
METLNEKKRKWIINQFRSGRSATSIARIQKISRQMVYKLATKYKKEGKVAYEAKKAGRPRYNLNKNFIKKVVELRRTTDYGSEKLHFVLNRAGFKVSQHIVQRVLDDGKLTEPCPKRRGQRKYVKYQWPISNFMWHCDYTFYKGKWYITYIDDRSRRIMAAGEFENATEENAIFLLHQAILINEVSPYIILSDKGTQFYNSTPNNQGELTPSLFEQELEELGIKFWTARRNHPQTNGKQERWFGTMKARFRKHPDESLQEFVLWYNQERIHHALDYKTPNEVYYENL